MSWYINSEDDGGLTGVTCGGETEEDATALVAAMEAAYPDHTFSAPYEENESNLRQQQVRDQTRVDQRNGTSFIIRSDGSVREDV